jgi:hypothetical protein
MTKQLMTFFVIGICCLVIVQTTYAVNFTKFVRKATNVADGVPIHGADDLVKTMSKSKASREALESSVKRIVKSTDPSMLNNAVKTELRTIDPSLVRFADDLDKPSKEYLIVLGEGAKTCNKNIPDMMQRAKFLEKGGAETVTAIGMYGDDIAKSAMRVDSAISGGKLISPKGMRAVTLNDYGKLFTKYGDNAKTFWDKYVVPHWGKWLVGGALAWYLIDPEGFMDNAGNLTKAGLERLTQCVGDVAAIAIEGVSKGAEKAIEKIATSTGDAVERIGKATLYSFFTSIKGIAALIVILFGVAVALPFTRFYVFGWFAFLLRKPRE